MLKVNRETDLVVEGWEIDTDTFINSEYGE
jgi:hypothetical protein